MERILVIEDTPPLREVLCKVIESQGYSVTPAHSAEDALELLNSEEFSMVLSDLKLPGKNALEFLQEAKQLHQTLPIVVMTAYGNIDIAVQAMKLGAVDFITKPFEPDHLCNLIAQVTKHRQVIDRSFGISTRKNRKLVTQSPVMEKLLHQARKVAPLSSSVIILGESGTGKELIARFLHENSTRANNPWVAVNCASMPSELLESEFFGHEAGSFTGATEKRLGLFEVAHTGTLFLDEIGTMPPDLQIKLLRTLQESEIKRLGSTKMKKIDTRVLCATNCDIQKEIQKGNFREDLYYRLGVVILEIPPLRDRPQDISLLANYFAKSFCQEFGKPEQVVTPAAMKLLERHLWIGNVRELENVIERAVILTDGPITPEALELKEGVIEGAEDNNLKTLPQVTEEAVRKVESEFIQKVLLKTRGNKSKAAQLLGISYKTLLTKVKEYHLDRETNSLGPLPH